MQMFSLSTMRGLSQSIVKYMFISGSYHGTVPTLERLEKQAVARLFLHFMFFSFSFVFDGFPLFFIDFHGFPGFQVPRARKMKKNEKKMKKMIKT